MGEWVLVGGLRVEVEGLGEAVNHGHSGVGGAGFTPPARCTTPHVSEEQVTEAFLDAVHHLLVSRDRVDELVDKAVRAGVFNCLCIRHFV